MLFTDGRVKRQCEWCGEALVAQLMEGGDECRHQSGLGSGHLIPARS